MKIIRATSLTLYYLALFIQKFILYLALPLFIFVLVFTLILLVKSNPMVAFIAFSAVIYAIEMGSSKPPKSGGVDPIFYVEDYVVPYEGEKKQYCEDYEVTGLELVSTSNSSTEDLDSLFYLRQDYVVAYDRGETIEEEDFNDDNKDDVFCPRLVYVEYKQKGVESVSNLPLTNYTSTLALVNTPTKYEEKLVKCDYYNNSDRSINCFRGYAHDGGGPGGGGGGGDIEDDRKFTRRIEDFIEKNNRKWKEDKLNEKLLHFGPTNQWQYAIAG